MSLNKPNLFVFEVIFKHFNGIDPQPGALPLEGRSVIVEVEPEGMARFMGIHHSSEVDRCFAEETAQQAALQTVQKDLPEGIVPSCEIVQLHRLPDELRRRPPTLHAGRAFAWLL
jgi:hypothetical protein